MKRLLLAGVFCSVLGSTMANAQSGVRLGEPGYGGNGCPQGTVSAILSPDASSLSILFDKFQATAGSFTDDYGNYISRQADRKSCNVRIPVHVPQGFSVSLIAIDYRGYNDLPVGASSEFNVEYFFAGQRGPRYTKRFQATRGRLSEDYLIENNLEATSLVWSACGAQVILAANSSVRVQTNSRMQQASMTMDSMDIEAGLVYHLRWRRCN